MTCKFKEFQPWHPERMPDEIFLGDFTTNGFNQIGWKTKRSGRYCYVTPAEMRQNASRNIVGSFNVITEDSTSIYPVFVKRSEIEQAGLEII